MPFSAERLRNIREQKGYMQRDLAELSGVSEAQISRYETGKMAPSLPNLESIVKLLGVSIDYLLGLVDDPNRHFGDRDISEDELFVLELYRRESWSGVAQLSVEKLSEMVEALAK